MHNASRLLKRIPILLALIAASCSSESAHVEALPSGGKTPPPPSEKDVKIITQGQKIVVSPAITIEADQYTPVLTLRSDEKSTPPPLELSKEVTIWDDGQERKFELLGLCNDVESEGRAYAIRINSKPAPRPKLVESAKGMYSWSYNNPTSLRTRGTIFSVSRNPLLFVASNAMDGELFIVTNYGAKVIDGKPLRPKAIKFKKNSGEVITAAWSQKLGDYDIPNSARGHGLTQGPVPGESSISSKIGPAHLKITRHFPFNGQTEAALDVSNPASFKGPLILSFTLPDFYSASLGMPTYVRPGSQPDINYKRYAQHDRDFRENWSLTLDPPILVEYGLGPQGVVNGAAKINCQIWKFGNHLYGSGGYTYSDCGLHGGGSLDGTIDGGVIKLKLAGSPNLTLTSTSVSGDRIVGEAVVSGTIPGGSYTEQPAGTDKRKFVLQAAQPQEESTYTRSSSENHSKGKYADLEKLAGGKDYWDALTVYPGADYRDSLALYTERLIQAEQSDPKNAQSPMDSLAHMQYCAWLSSKNKRGVQHPITVANAKVAESLYKRILDAQGRRDSYADRARKRLEEMKPSLK